MSSLRYVAEQPAVRPVSVEKERRRTKDERRKTDRPFVLRPSSLVLALLIGASFLLTRLFNLGLLPMVSDEGTYITWGVRALHARYPEEWLASLEDGKQPLLAWLMPPVLAAIPDRLLAGRLVSVAAGAANVVLLAGLGRRLFSPAAGVIAAALYVVAPIALVHDRMALYDSLVTTTALGVLWAALAWAQRPDWRRTLALGLAMGVALLTKLSALFFVALVPVVVVLWQGESLRRWWRLAQAHFLAAAIYSVLYASPIVNNIQEGNFQRYSLTAGEVLRLPVDIWLRNGAFLVGAAATYLGWPLTLLAAAAVSWIAWHGGRRGWALALWTLVPLVAFMLTAKIIYSRYVVFCFVSALVPVAALLSTLPRRVAWLLGALAALPGLLFAVPLLTDPAAAPWMNDRRYITDRFQYIESNYAGYGLRDIVEYLRAEARRGPVVVFTRATTGMPRDGVTAYLLEWPNVHVGFVAGSESVLDRLRREPDRAYRLMAQGAPAYHVLTDAPGGEQEQRFRRLNPAATLVLDIPKPGNHSRFQLYRLPALQDGGDTWFTRPARFGAAILLQGFSLSATTVRPGESIRLALYWEATGRPDRDYTVFNQVIGERDAIWGQKDSQPAGGRRPTSRWRPGEYIPDVYELTIKPEAPPGTYDLITGLYELSTLRRLPVTQAPETPEAPGRVVAAGALNDRIILAQITIEP